MAFQLNPVYIGNNNNMMPDTSDYRNMDLNNFLNFLKQGNNGFGVYGLPKEEQLSDDQIKSVINNGINNGNKYISEWQTANNVRKPQDEEEIELARAGQFNTPTLSTALSQKQEQPRRNSFLEGYRDNYNNSFSFSNLRNNPEKDWQYRLGEGLGTVGRFIDSPLGRGVIAAGLNKALGYDNSALEGLQAFAGRNNAVTTDRLYRNELKKYGYTDEDLAGIGGTITSDVFKNLSNNAYKNKQLETRLAIANTKDNNTAAKMILDAFKNGLFSEEEAVSELQKKGININSLMPSNETRRTDSQIAVNEARAENIRNPKAKKTIREGKTVIEYRYPDGKPEKTTTKTTQAKPQKKSEQTQTTNTTGTTKNGTKYRIVG